MRNFQQKRGWRDIFESWPILFLLIILLFFFAYGMIGFMGKMKETGRNRNIAENKIAELEKGKEKLNSDIAKLKTEEGVEENIRDKFGLAKEGEGLIVVVEDKSEAKIVENKSTGFFSFFKNLFK